jgi:hypothetical protein
MGRVMIIQTMMMHTTNTVAMLITTWTTVARNPYQGAPIYGVKYRGQMM